MALMGGDNPTPVTPAGGRDSEVVRDDDGAMSNSFDSASGQPFGASPGQRPQAAPASPRRTRTAGHIVLIVIGCLALVPGFAMVAGGSAIAVGQAVATDDDGYFRLTLDRVESSGVAIATADLWLDDVEGDASPWFLDWVDLDLRLRVDGANATDDVFVGIARSSDVERYLSAATFSEIVELDERTPTYREVTANNSIDPPIDQGFWAATASGPGEQELQWTARGGRWSVVVMNADGSPAVAADVEVGVKSDAVTPIAVVLLATGGAILLVGVVLIVVGVRGRRSPAADSGRASFGSTPLPPPTPATAESAAPATDEERHPTPVG